VPHAGLTQVNLSQADSSNRAGAGLDASQWYQNLWPYCSLWFRSEVIASEPPKPDRVIRMASAVSARFHPVWLWAAALAWPEPGRETLEHDQHRPVRTHESL